MFYKDHTRNSEILRKVVQHADGIDDARRKGVRLDRHHRFDSRHRIDSRLIKVYIRTEMRDVYVGSILCQGGHLWYTAKGNTYEIKDNGELGSKW